MVTLRKGVLLKLLHGGLDLRGGVRPVISEGGPITELQCEATKQENVKYEKKERKKKTRQAKEKNRENYK